MRGVLLLELPYSCNLRIRRPMNNSGLSCSIRSNVFDSLIFCNCIVSRRDCSYGDRLLYHRFCIYSVIALLILLCFYSCDNRNPIRSLFPRRSIRNTSSNSRFWNICNRDAPVASGKGSAKRWFSWLAVLLYRVVLSQWEAGRRDLWSLRVWCCISRVSDREWVWVSLMRKRSLWSWLVIFGVWSRIFTYYINSKSKK